MKPRRSLRELTDSLLDRFSIACGDGGALDSDDGNDSIRRVVEDFRMNQARAADILQRLESLSRRMIAAADGYWVGYRQKTQAESDAVKRKFQEIVDEARRLQHL